MEPRIQYAKTADGAGGIWPVLPAGQWRALLIQKCGWGQFSAELGALVQILW